MESHHIVVTGASQGIGEAVALAMAPLPGMRLSLTARNEARLDSVADACRALGAEAAVLPCDVTDVDAVRRMAGMAADRFGVPTLVVNNAGAFVPGTIADTEPADFTGLIAVNLTSAFLVTRAFVDGMRRRGSGHFLFMGSVASVRGYAGGVAYCAAKHGLLGLARTVREELRSEGIRVTTLLPGATMTPSWEGAGLPEDRLMPPEDIARLVRDTYLLGDRTVVEEILVRPQLGDL